MNTKTLATTVALASILAVLVATSALAASNSWPSPNPQDLATPFTGKPVPTQWSGTWTETKNSGSTWRIFGRRSAACRSITAARTSCWTLRPPGFTVDWAGAVTVKNGIAIFRMTFNPKPGSLSCFNDDAYKYRFTPHRLTLLKGNGPHCFWDPSQDRFPVVLSRHGRSS